MSIKDSNILINIYDELTNEQISSIANETKYHNGLFNLSVRDFLIIETIKEILKENHNCYIKIGNISE